ncbi:hypothetical protein TI05_09015 [Achromatium sp. WMS3]|nr:hypothetical protein TI05_09015 [Achromatium sp. WMS3]
MKIGQIHKNLMYSHNMVSSVGWIGGIIANQIFFLSIQSPSHLHYDIIWLCWVTKRWQPNLRCLE